MESSRGAVRVSLFVIIVIVIVIISLFADII